MLLTPAEAFTDKAQQRCCTAIQFANCCFQLKYTEAPFAPADTALTPLPAVSVACLCLAE